MEKNRKINSIFWGMGIVIYSLLIFVILLAGNKDAFYASDDIMQWGPVVNKGFEQIFSGKGIPYWDFYQYKGLDIFSSGYYGFLNPFMYISYFISRFILAGQIETLNVYKWIMYCLGNLTIYKVLEDFSLRKTTIVIAVLTYSTSLMFFEYIDFYFYFNNYFFVPFMIWIIMHVRNNKTEWFVPGVILAFSLLMGHVQQSCYYVMVYCIIQVVFSVQEKNFKPILKMLLNIAFFVLLSAFQLMASMAVSEYRSVVLASDPTDSFISMEIDIFTVFDLFNIVPLTVGKYGIDRFYHNLGLGIFVWLSIPVFFPEKYKKFRSFVKSKIYYINDKFIKVKGERYCKTMHYFLAVMAYIFSLRMIFLSLFEYYVLDNPDITIIAVLVVVIAAFIISILSKKQFMISEKSLDLCIFLCTASICMLLPFAVYIFAVVLYIRKMIKNAAAKNFSDKELIIHAFMFAGFFFVLFSLGYYGIVALILSLIPVINQFRYLYKCAFIFIPILIVTGAFMLDRINGKFLKVLYRVSAVCIAVSLMNVCYVIYSGQHEYINNDKYDYQHYRESENEVIAILDELDIDKNYRFLTISGHIDNVLKSYTNKSSSICVYGLTKNYCTLYELFSLCGYDNIFSAKGFEQSDAILQDIFYEGMFSNMMNSAMTNIDNMRNDKAYFDKFEEQMINNGVKYVLVTSDDLYLADEFTALLNDMNSRIKVVRTVPWVEGMQLIELDGVRPVCSYGNMEELPLDTLLDELSFHTDFEVSTPVTVSMTYEPHYKAYITDKDGNTLEISISGDKDGYVTFDVPAGNYDVTMKYENKMMDMAVYEAGAVILLTIIFAAVVYFSCRKKPKIDDKISENDFKANIIPEEK